MGKKIEIKQRNWEGVLVVILLMIIFMVLTPYVSKIIYNAQVSGALSSSEGLVVAVKTAYTKGNLVQIIDLPFEIKYENKEYIAYSNGKQIKIEEMLKSRESVYDDSITVKFDKITEKAINILIYSYTNSIDYSTYLSEAEDINMKILKILREENINFAYDTKNVYIKS